MIATNCHKLPLRAATCMQPTTRPIYHVEWAANGCDSGLTGPSSFHCTHIEFDVMPNASSTTFQQSFQSTFAAGMMLADSCPMTSSQCMDRSKVGPGGIELVMAAAHCHAPNCIRQVRMTVGH